MNRLFIGIDPGESNGLATYSASDGLKLYTESFWDLCKFIKATSKLPDTDPLFIVENPNLNTFIFQQRSTGMNNAAALRMARNVGMNQNDAKRIIELIKMLGMKIEEVKPISGSAKWSGDFFNRIIRQEIRCSQHARDAAKLISKYWIDSVQNKLPL